MRLTNFLQEMTTTTATIKPYAEQPDIYEVSIDTNDGHKFWFKAEKQSFMPPYETQFKDVFGSDIYDLILSNSLFINAWDIEFVDENHDQNLAPKGAGTALSLFAALETVFAEWFMKYQPNFFFFGALFTESSRTKLYDTIARKIKSRLTKYIHMRFKSGQIEYNFFIKKMKYTPVHTSRYDYRLK